MNKKEEELELDFICKTLRDGVIDGLVENVNTDVNDRGKDSWKPTPFLLWLAENNLLEKYLAISDDDKAFIRRKYWDIKTREAEKKKK